MVPQIKDLQSELAAQAPDLAEKMNFGLIDMNAHVDLHANAFGLAYGLGHGVMIVGTLPIISADVRLNGGYQGTTSVQDTIAALQQRSASLPTRSPRMDALIQLLQQLPSPTGGNLQAAIVEKLGYKPVGNWSGGGIGDAEVFAHYRFIDNPHYREAVRLGIDAPTGRVKDPDNLVDIPFGKGNASIFAQTIHDFPIWNEHVTFHAQGKFEYEVPASRTYRLFSDPSVPLSSEKETLDYQRGNRWSLGSGTSLQFFVPGLKFTAEYEYSGQFRDSVTPGQKAGYDYSILTQRSDMEAHTITVGVSFSTVPMFLSKKFPIPCMLGLNYSRVFSGVNADQVEMAYLHFESYF